MTNDGIDKIVEKLSVDELKKLAVREIRGLRGFLELDIQNIRHIRNHYGSDKEKAMKIAVSSYEGIKEEMQKYGVWKEQYEKVYLQARINGVFDAELFFKK